MLHLLLHNLFSRTPSQCDVSHRLCDSIVVDFGVPRSYLELSDGEVREKHRRSSFSSDDAVRFGLGLRCRS
jgi:hypothetical protein